MRNAVKDSVFEGVSAIPVEFSREGFGVPFARFRESNFMCCIQIAGGVLPEH
jgi:hypothetical protein